MDEQGAWRVRIPGSAPVPDERAMRVALDAARRGLMAGQPPVGACVIEDGRVVASAHNAVAEGPDATAHAEILAIRAACRQLRTTSLAGCDLYVTVEPCPMCLAACHYAGVARVFFGADLHDMQEVTGRELFGSQPAGVLLVGGVLAAECRAILGEWAAARRAGP